MTKIYCYFEKEYLTLSNKIYYLTNAAVLVDGQLNVIHGTASSLQKYMRSDIGHCNNYPHYSIKYNKAHELYKELFPKGYEIVWFDTKAQAEDSILFESCGYTMSYKIGKMKEFLIEELTKHVGVKNKVMNTTLAIRYFNKQKGPNSLKVRTIQRLIRKAIMELRLVGKTATLGYVLAARSGDNGGYFFTKSRLESISYIQDIGGRGQVMVDIAAQAEKDSLDFQD